MRSRSEDHSRVRASTARGVWAVLRNTWRGLTAMRTALVLLFLLALGAMPGALLPQRPLNPTKVDAYLAQHTLLGPWLDRLGFFNVYGSTWFAAIYVLLFISLVGCLLPRTFEHAGQMRAKPVLTPRNLARMPHHARATVDASVDEVITAARRRLRGWRIAERAETSLSGSSVDAETSSSGSSVDAGDGGARTISAERGYLRDIGNLLFHFALVGLIVSFAMGKMFGYEGQVIVMANGSQEFCNSGVLNYDSFRPGLSVDGTQLDPFCVRVNSFQATYQPSGQPESYQADISYQAGQSLTSGRWQPYTLQVNHPLRVVGDRVYLLGHGYAPQFTVTFPGGAQRTQLVQWKTMDPMTLLAEGATKFDPPGVTDPDQRRRSQLAVTGLLAPTAAFDGTLLSSSFPALHDPAVAVDVLRGDLGIDSGRGQSIFTVDQTMVDSGRLQRVARQNLRPGQEIRLDDGTVVHFDGVAQWASLQVSHDPTQVWMLVCSILVIGGIGVSLRVKRRRLWLRVTPEGGAPGTGRTVVEVGGLARTDQAGYGEEFSKLAGDLLAVRAGAARAPAGLGTGGSGRDV